MKIGLAGLFIPVLLAAQTVTGLDAWLKLRRALIAGETTLEQLRESTLPVIEGTVVTMEPATRPRTLLIGVETPQIGELRLEIRRDGQPARMRTTPPRKSKIRFRAAEAVSFTKRPFVLTAVIDEMDLDFEEVE